MTSASGSVVSPAGGYRVGVDTGGTHTDLVLVDSDTHRLITYKVPSTLGDLTEGILSGLRGALAAAGTENAAIDHFVYATTMVTNLIVEGVASNVGLITTEGFRDILEIGRASRKPHIYDIQWRPAKPLVPRPLRLGVRERIAHTGDVLESLDEAGVRAALRQLRGAGCTSIGVCFLNSYANPAHEERVAVLAAEECPDVEISLSSAIVREFREYERVSSTVLDAYVKRPLGRHLAKLAMALHDRGVSTPPFIMRGNGGISTFEVAARTPVAITHSGPMGGIIGGTALAQACGISDIITLDMGGTSADVSLVLGSKPIMTTRGKLGPYPLLLPMLDLVTIGAGGGSLAWLEREQALRVGPRSAGAYPGPACYGQGGTEPTVTDANVFAGRLNPDNFLDGRRKLDPALARQALETVARPLGMELGETAMGILSIAESHMVNAIKLISVDRGVDPRDFTLIGFGGAGPLHSIRLAEELSIMRVLIPPAPGNVSSMGLLTADVRHDLVRTRVVPLADAAADMLAGDLSAMIEEATHLLDRDGVGSESRLHVASLDLRYQGQNYELNLPVADGRLTPEGLRSAAERFHAEHERIYGYRLPSRTIELVNVRLTALRRIAGARWPEIDTRGRSGKPIGKRKVALAWGVVANVAVYRFGDIVIDQDIEGPAIVEYPGSTLFVPPGWHGRYDRMGNAHLHNTAQRRD